MPLLLVMMLAPSVLVLGAVQVVIESPPSSARAPTTVTVVEASSLVEALALPATGPLSVTDTVTVAVCEAVTPWLSVTV